jgi:hypothetical protein
MSRRSSSIGVGEVERELDALSILGDAAAALADEGDPSLGEERWALRPPTPPATPALTPCRPPRRPQPMASSCSTSGRCPLSCAAPSATTAAPRWAAPASGSRTARARPPKLCLQAPCRAVADPAHRAPPVSAVRATAPWRAATPVFPPAQVGALETIRVCILAQGDQASPGAVKVRGAHPAAASPLLCKCSEAGLPQPQLQLQPHSAERLLLPYPAVPCPAETRSLPATWAGGAELRTQLVFPLHPLGHGQQLQAHTGQGQLPPAGARPA